MPGGFLAGLGQGLQRAGGAVGEHAELRQRKNMMDEEKRRFDLSHALAEKAARDQTNRWGVDDLYRQGDMRLREEQLAQQKNQMGMQYAALDRQAWQDERNYALQQKNQETDALYKRALANQANAYANSAGNKYQNRYYGAQIMRPMIDSIDREMGRITAKWQDKLGLGMMTNDPLRNQDMQQLQRLQQSKRVLMQEMARDLEFDPNVMDALNMALSDGSTLEINPAGLQQDTTPQQNQLEIRPQGGLFRR